MKFLVTYNQPSPYQPPVICLDDPGLLFKLEPTHIEGQRVEVDGWLTPGTGKQHRHIYYIPRQYKTLYRASELSKGERAGFTQLKKEARRLRDRLAIYEKKYGTLE